MGGNCFNGRVGGRREGESGGNGEERLHSSIFIGVLYTSIRMLTDCSAFYFGTPARLSPASRRPDKVSL